MKENECGAEDGVLPLSSCCAAEIIDTDICSVCREHCDPIMYVAPILEVEENVHEQLKAHHDKTDPFRLDIGGEG